MLLIKFTVNIILYSSPISGHPAACQTNLRSRIYFHPGTVSLFCPSSPTSGHPAACKSPFQDRLSSWYGFTYFVQVLLLQDILQHAKLRCRIDFHPGTVSHILSKFSYFRTSCSMLNSVAEL